MSILWMRKLRKTKNNMAYEVGLRLPESMIRSPQDHTTFILGQSSQQFCNTLQLFGWPSLQLKWLKCLISAKSHNWASLVAQW